MKIVYCTKLGQAQTAQEREQLEQQMMSNPEGESILNTLKGKATNESTTLKGRMQREQRELTRRAQLKLEALDILQKEESSVPVSEVIDLDTIAFQQGGHLMSNKQCKLPEGSFQKQKKGYEEITIPAVKSPPYGSDERLVPIAELPDWAQTGFRDVKTLNRIQSKCYKGFFEGSDNLLLCAPTGAGKTNCAMLAMLHEIGTCSSFASLSILGQHFTNKKKLTLDLDSFKMIYVAPMKSLVQEMVTNFGNRLQPYGIKVAELTGDASMTKQQIHDTQLIITTPEKWDVITRKSGERSYTRLVRLVIIDEIHLLHDDRGPVLESLIARTIRQIESTQEMVRLIGLSATLPNYHDVATVLRVKPENLYAFKNNMRPIPLEQTYVGVSVKSPFKRFQKMNEICYEKVTEHAKESQVLVFVHSRKETASTARMLRDNAIADNTITRYVGEDSGVREILRSEAESCKNPALSDLLPYGFACHHAGMTREDRNLVEDLFKEGHIRVLVSTATLAWGVNLPAHTVIIKGTKIYSPDQGDWVELSHLDVMQMFGRAGRPGYDLKGEACLITGRQELQYYLSLLNEQLPIESQYIKKLADNLNAEIVLGTVQNAKEAVNWLGYTYLYVCMLRNPELYGVSPSAVDKDKHLKQRRYDLIHSAATVLAKNNLINYDRKSGNFQVTDLGRIASHYYIAHHSMSVYNEHLKPTTSDIELLKIFSLSNEFSNVAVRPDEREELKRLLDRVPIPIKESMEETSAKINVLLQAYISRLELDGFSLVSDMVFIRQSAGRIMRALFEIALKRGWAALAERCLKYCQMIERRMWSTQSELRQFKVLAPGVLKTVERKGLTVEKLYPLDSSQIGEAIDHSAARKVVYNLVHAFPRLDLSATVQPITRSLLRMELTILCDFTYNLEYHGPSVSFWILVMDVDGENILHHELFVLKERLARDKSHEHFLSFTVPLFEPLPPPQYFIKVVADRWLGSETILPVSFRNLLLPEKYPPHTDLLDLQPLPVAALKNPRYEAIYKDMKYFNPIQTQVFNTFYNTDQNALVCSPSGSGKLVCAEFAIMREWSRETPGIIVYVAPMVALAHRRLEEWSEKFAKLGKRVSLLTGEWALDSKLLSSSDISIATPEIWDMALRRWNKRKVVQSVKLYIFDELHMIGADDGPTYEIVVSRVRMINSQLQMQKAAELKQKISQIPSPTRIVGLASSVANAPDVGAWIGATPHSLFNFHSNVRPVPLEIQMQGFDHPSFKANILSMSRLLLYSVSHHAEDKPVMIFAPSRKLCRSVAQELIIHSNAEQTPKRYLHVPAQDLQPLLVRLSSTALRESLTMGVGFFHEALTETDKQIVMSLFKSGAIQVLIVSQALIWEVPVSAHLIIVMGTQYYEGKESRYVDYPITTLLEMIGKAGRPGEDDFAKCIIYGHSRRKEFYKKFIHEPLPIESHLDQDFPDHLNAEVVLKTVENKQEAVDYLTWTFYYRRITQNPNYYHLKEATHIAVSDNLSDLVENSLTELEDAKCVFCPNEDEVQPVNLGIIASYYYVKYTTIDVFNYLLNKNIKLKGILQVLASSTEFERLSIRHKEDIALKKLASHLPHSIAKPDYSTTPTKVNILLQAYFSRRELPPDLARDQAEILRISPRLIQAMVDVIASNGWLTPVLAVMELSQMITQAMWLYEPRLKQLPHFTTQLIKKYVLFTFFLPLYPFSRFQGLTSCSRIQEEIPDCAEVLDIGELEDEQRDKVLKDLTEEQVRDIAVAVNRYPNIEMAIALEEEGTQDSFSSPLPGSACTPGSDVTVQVQFDREELEGEKLGPVYAPHFPTEKAEGWWLVVGNPETNSLLTIKRISVAKSQVATSLEFTAPEEPGVYNLKVFFMCDSYFGCDQEWPLTLTVAGTKKEEVEEMDVV
jgi:pre-mRNA-splicing helicase BRR2